MTWRTFGLMIAFGALVLIALIVAQHIVTDPTYHLQLPTLSE